MEMEVQWILLMSRRWKASGLSMNYRPGQDFSADVGLVNAQLNV
jgi:hypothetical protein